MTTYKTQKNKIITNQNAENQRPKRPEYRMMQRDPPPCDAKSTKYGPQSKAVEQLPSKEGSACPYDLCNRNATPGGSKGWNSPTPGPIFPMQ
jgi:hypothetical protein